MIRFLFWLIATLMMCTSSTTAMDSDAHPPHTPAIAFDGVPSSYAECMSTAASYEFPQGSRSQLRCDYVVRGGVEGKAFAEGDKAKFGEYQRKGGINPTYERACGLVFYNPDYVFPTDFKKCVKEKKGDFTTFEHRCHVEIIPSLAYDKDVATRLIRECRRSGGTYEEVGGHPRCYLEFTEPSR